MRVTSGVMTGVITLAMTAALFVFGPVVTAQRTGALLDADAIVKQIGSETDAKAILALVFARLESRTERELFLSNQIRAEWLPDTDRLTDIEAQATLNNCGTHWIVSSVQRSGNVLRLRLVSRCEATTREYVMHVSGGEWKDGPFDLPEGQVWSPGLGSGFVGGPPPGCPCLPPG